MSRLEQTKNGLKDIQATVNEIVKDINNVQCWDDMYGINIQLGRLKRDLDEVITCGLEAEDEFS